VSVSHDSLDLPRAFGPYLLLRRLAVGGMAEVYVARARGISGFEKLVAIKVIHPRYSEDEHFIKLLVEEAKISVLLTHVNVGQIFDLGVVDDTYYIALEYIEGADAYRMQRKASDAGVALPIDVCTFIAAEVCHGLDYAHRKRDADGKPLGIVHRDISPQNVLVSFAGEVKIVDFGIAKAALRSGQTEAGVIKGKYYYMSPEQAWGDAMDHRSDIFSAGIVLYELLIGEMLYREDNIPMLLDRVRKAEIPPPNARRPEVSPELSAIVMRALAKRPEDRFQSAHEMAQALMQLLYKTSPSFTASRVAQLMSQLFPTEIRRNAELAALASDEHDAAEAAEAARKVAQKPAFVVKPPTKPLPREPMPTKAPPARAAASSLMDDEDEDDHTRNDVMPFRRAMAQKAAAAPVPPAEQTFTEEISPSAVNEVPTRAVSLPATQREDPTGPLTRETENAGEWDDAPTSVLGGADAARAIAALSEGAARPATAPRAAAQVAVPARPAPVATPPRPAPVATPAAADDEDDGADWGDSTVVDDGVASARVQAMLRDRLAAKVAAAAEAPAPSAQRAPPAKPRSLPPPSRRPPSASRDASRAAGTPSPGVPATGMPSSAALAPPRVPRIDGAPPPRSQPNAAPPLRPAPQPAPPQRAAPAQPNPPPPQRQAPPADPQPPQPPPYPQAYVAAPSRQQQPAANYAAPSPYSAPPIPYSAPAPQYAQPPVQYSAAQPQYAPAPRAISPFDPVAYAPQPVPVATSWPADARSAPAPTFAQAPQSSVDPRIGPAFDPFAPPPPPGASTAGYAAVAGGGNKRRGLLFALIGIALFVVLIVIGSSALFASRKPVLPAQVASVPSGAHVRVDGVDVAGRTPLFLPAPLDPTQPHLIEVTLDAFEPYRIDVPAGDRQASHLAILTPK